MIPPFSQHPLSNDRSEEPKDDPEGGSDGREGWTDCSVCGASYRGEGAARNCCGGSLLNGGDQE